MQTERNESDPRRRPRSVMASDRVWDRIRKRAKAAGMSISSFICLRTTVDWNAPGTFVRSRRAIDRFRDRPCGFIAKLRNSPGRKTSYGARCYGHGREKTVCVGS